MWPTLKTGRARQRAVAVSSDDVPVAADSIAGIVLAAGAASRFGYRPKALLERDGEPLVWRQIRLLSEAGLRHIVVVSGHHADAVEPVLSRAMAGGASGVQLRVARNPMQEPGPGASLRCGLAQVALSMSAVMVVLADQPLLELPDVRAVLHAWSGRAPGTQLVVPTYQGQPGHPLVFGAELRQWLATQPATAGVRDWRRAHAKQVHTLPLDHPRCTRDIDTPEDLQTLADEHGVVLRWPVSI